MSISEQIELAFNPAEPRGAHGEWVYSGQPMYHGSRYRFKVGDTLEGGKIASNQGAGVVGDHVYMSSDPNIAGEFAGYAYGRDRNENATAHVYQVEPVEDDLEADPDENAEAHSFRSKKVRVVRVMPRIQWIAGYQQATLSSSGNITTQIELAAWQHEARGPHGEWVKGPRSIAQAMGIPSEPVFQFAHRVVQRKDMLPAKGDIAFMERPGRSRLVGRIVARAGLVAGIDADDGNRYHVDVRNGKIAKKIPLSKVGPGLPASSPHAATVEAFWKNNGFFDAAPVSLIRDSHPPNPDAPWLVKAQEHGGNGISEFHVNHQRALQIKQLMTEARRLAHSPMQPGKVRRFGGPEDLHALGFRTPKPTAPGEEVSPGVKQYILPGMEDVTTEYGQNSAPVQKLRKLWPDIQRVLDGDRSGKAGVQTPHQGIQGETNIVTLPDGTKVIVKDQNTIRQDREELAYYVSQAIGGGLPAIARDPKDPRRAVQEYVDGVMAERYAEEQSREGGDWGPDYSPQDIEDEITSGSSSSIGLLDYLTSNGDRHDQNWMVTPQGYPVPIDMGSASFDDTGTNSPFWNELDMGDEDWARETLRSLAPLQQEFTRAGHPDWFANMMEAASQLGGDMLPGNVFRRMLAGQRVGPSELSSISGQLLELAAWQHELRGPHGEWVTAIGDPLTAQHVLTYVPGVGTDADVPGEIAHAQQVKTAMDDEFNGSTAVVLWRGYRPPAELHQALRKEDAIQAAGKLASFQAELEKENPGAHFTVLGHSYGSLVAGEAAARHGMKAQDTVFVGSPGVGVRHASQLGQKPGHVWAAMNSRDPIRDAASVLSLDYKGNPVHPRFGARVFNAEVPGTHGLGIYSKAAHESYFGYGSEALSNIARIATSKYVNVGPGPGSGPPLGTSNREVLNLSWRDAWRTEPRDFHGRWTRGGAVAAVSGGLLHKVKTGLLDSAGLGYRPASPEIHAFTARAAAAMPHILGGGTQGFSGKVYVADKLSQPESLAQMEWNGDMLLRSDVASQLHHALTTDDPSSPAAAEDIEHELIHGVTASATYDGDFGENRRAYQHLPTAIIEEGFTELGAIQHAGEFFRTMGIDGKPAPEWSVNPAGRVLVGRHATYAEVAARAAEPLNVSSGDGWGHYGNQVAAAYGWAKSIAEMEHAADIEHRIVELADEINQRGAAGKADAMAAQVISAIARTHPGGWGNLHISPQMLDGLRQEIMDGFYSGGGTEAAKRGAATASAQLAALAAQQ